MSHLSHILATVHSLSDPIPNPAPKDPTGGGPGISLVMSYIKYGVLTACAAAFLIGGGLIAFGKVFESSHSGSRGKQVLLGAIGGAVIVGGGIQLIQSIYDATAA